MSIFTDNISVIRKKLPELKINDINLENNLTFFNSKSGNISAKLKGIYIHSKFDPVKEANNIIEKECKGEIKLCIFYGFGLGYHIQCFLNKLPDTNAIVIIPDLSFFLKALESRDMTEFLSSQNLFFFIDNNPDNFLFFLTDLQNEIKIEDIKTFKLRSIYLLKEDYYKRIDGIIESYNSRKEINFNTLERFGKLWVRNLLKNMNTLSISPGISFLESLFQNLPVLILASGPSLDKIIPILPELYKRMIIICVDTSLNSVLETGIEPDFIIIADPQYWNTRHIDRAQVKKSILISESSTHPSIFRKLNLITFFGSSLFPLGQYFESFIGVKGKLGAGGSVATSAWDFSRILGAKNIYFAGLDLGYPGNNTHFKGAFFETRFHVFTGRTNPVSTLTYSYFMEADPFLINSNSDKLVYTDKRMMVYKWWFESQVNLFPAVNSYNLSEYGVNIKGIPHKSLNSILKLPEIRNNISENIIKIKEKYDNFHLKENRNILISSLKYLKNDLNNIIKLSEKAIIEVKKIEKMLKIKTDISRSLILLNKIDNDILNIGTRQIAGFLIQSFIKTISNSPDDKKSDMEIIDSSLKLYTELKDSSSYHYKILLKAINQLKTS